MENLKVKELIEICDELALTLGRAKRKQAILENMQKEGVTAEEVDEAWADIKERREEAERRELREREETERQERREREEAERRELREREEAERQERREREEREERLEMKRIELALRQCSQAPSVASATVQASGHRIRDQLPPFVVGEDMAKYLVKFEHVCDRNGIERSLWAQNLLALLPGEVSDVITYLSREAFDSYDEVKEALLRRYKLSPEAFRQRFRYAKRGNESHVDFAFRLKADLIEWLKGEDVYDDRDKVVECIALEQFYRCIEYDVKLWLQDKLGEVQPNKAAELAEEYYTRRNLHSRAVRVEKAERKEGFSKKPDDRKPAPHRNFRKDPSFTKETVREGQTEAQKSSEFPKERTDTTRAFESRKPLICYNCKKEGHIAVNCKQKIAFATIRESENNIRLLEPYIQEISVNGKTCRALRDSAANMDVVHPSLVAPNDWTGECAWIRQVAEEQSTCTTDCYGDH
ncbi:putative golgin subfamily A member 6-like protein 3 [Rhipicephalus sanguineus]|uniref:putative golgin subfamily A member 6-like protein 3 n=1 Tax=Rhipicephalus sanguineus TaxID=34632 RepID=UPI0020C25511|nr:putative golgin subfamily A member 6-like protein 3 [Rhipicephalus sanguineus]